MTPFRNAEQIVQEVPHARMYILESPRGIRYEYKPGITPLPAGRWRLLAIVE